jgi:phosphoenolpyruvate carboxykinase (ATP)
VGGPAVQLPKLNDRQKEIMQKLPDTLDRVHQYLTRIPVVRVERTMGDNDEFAPRCTMYTSLFRKDSVRLPYFWSQMLFEKKPAVGPHFILVYVPEWPEIERQILVFPELGVTYVLGSDYPGEAKKGFLRMAMWEAKGRNMLGLHAGSKMIDARDRSGKLRRWGVLLFGLSATGKTTHSCHDHGLKDEGEKVEIVQDDVVFLKRDGSALGTERGFYIKTDGLHPDTQPLLYKAAISRDAVFENIMVDWQGNVDFQDEVLTENGRGVIQMSDLGEAAAKSVNLPPADELDGLFLFFITRRHTVLPIVQKLTAAQATATFMLGESIETSAGDPRKAGESVRVVGTNPFIVGDLAEEGNIFYRFISQHPAVQCYVLNTGGVGEIREVNEAGFKVIKRKVTRVEIPEMASVIRGIARQDIEWVDDPNWGTLAPKKVDGFDLSRLDPAKFYDPAQLEGYVRQLKKERIEYMKAFPNLAPEVVATLT